MNLEDYNLKCIKDGDCPFDFCVIKNKSGFHKCMYLEISSE